MSQSYVPLVGTDTLTASRSLINNMLDALASRFSGTAFPTTNLVIGMQCLRTDESKVYQLTSTGPSVWKLVFDLAKTLQHKEDADALYFALVNEATAAQWRNNTADKVLTTDQLWAAAAEVTLTDSADTITVDLNSGFDFHLPKTLSGSTLTFSNAKVGQRGRIRIVQDGTGGRTISTYTNCVAPGGRSTIVLSTAANAEDYLLFDVVSASKILISIIKDAKA